MVCCLGASCCRDHWPPQRWQVHVVNRLVAVAAIVHDEPGVTRDRTYQDGYWGDREFKVVDTGGLVFDDIVISPEIREQAALPSKRLLSPW